MAFCFYSLVFTLSKGNEAVDVATADTIDAAKLTYIGVHDVNRFFNLSLDSSYVVNWATFKDMALQIVGVAPLQQFAKPSSAITLLKASNTFL